MILVKTFTRISEQVTESLLFLVGRYPFLVLRLSKNEGNL
jgi:hypothetical protein